MSRTPDISTEDSTVTKITGSSNVIRDIFTYWSLIPAGYKYYVCIDYKDRWITRVSRGEGSDDWWPGIDHIYSLPFPTNEGPQSGYYSISRWCARYCSRSHEQCFVNANRKSKCSPKVINNAQICCRNIPPFQIRWGSKMIPGLIKKIFVLKYRPTYLHRRRPITETRVVSSTETSIVSLRGIVVLLWSYEIISTTACIQ